MTLSAERVRELAAEPSVLVGECPVALQGRGEEEASVARWPAGMALADWSLRVPRSRWIWSRMSAWV